MGVEHLVAQETQNLHCHCRYVQCGFLRGYLASQPKRPLQTFGNMDTELGQQAADHVHQLRTLLDQKIAGAVKRQGRLLLG